MPKDNGAIPIDLQGLPQDVSFDSVYTFYKNEADPTKQQLVRGLWYGASLEQLRGTLRNALRQPISCVDVSQVVRQRSDAVARKARTSKYPVVIQTRKAFIELEHAKAMYPRKAHQLQEHYDRFYGKQGE